MRVLTFKIKEAEDYIDAFIRLHGVPPTYQQVASHLGISKTAAFARCKGFRHKINKPRQQIKDANIKLTRVQIGFAVPMDKLQHFYDMIRDVHAYINQTI